MKKVILLTISIIILNALSVKAQEDTIKVNSELPKVDLLNLEGETFNTENIKNDGPIFISFWATWCKPCIKELITVNENFEDWTDETGFKVYAISVDDERTSDKVAPFINSRGWEYEVLLDKNGDFKRAMNVVNVPHSFILDKNGKIVWQHTSFSPGDEEEIYQILKKVADGEEIKE